MERIVITGSTGFVGSNLVPYLASHHTLITPGRLQINSPLPQYDSIIHLAGKAHDLKNISLPEVYYSTNFELTKKLYDDFIASDAKKFVFISSIKAAADHLSAPLTEDYPPQPQTHYGKSKLKAEQYIQNQSLPEGKSYYILRPCMIHGPGNKGNLNLLYRLVSKNIPYPLAAFENRRSFLSVKNLCFIIREIVERRDIPSGIYHLADDNTLSTNKLIEIIAATSGRKSRLWKISPEIIKFIARVGDIVKLPLNTERLDKLTGDFVVDNSKIKKSLGKDLPLTSSEGIKLTIQSFSEQA